MSKEMIYRDDALAAIDMALNNATGDLFDCHAAICALPAIDPSDRIEQLVKERDYTEGTNDTLIALNQALEDKLALMIFERDEVMMFERDEAWKRAAYSEKMWGEAEVKLAKAVEVLRPFAKTPETWGLRHVEFTFEELRPARTLLAELEGK